MKNIFLLSGLSFLLIACLGEQKEIESERKIFRYNHVNNISTLDPVFAKTQNNIWATAHLFNGLVQLDEQHNVKACIAKAWEIADDGKTYTFHLRSDVYFHDHQVFEGGKGRRLKASDVVYSFKRLLDENIDSPGAWIFKERIATQDPFVALDDTSFVLNLSVPFRPMLGMLSMPYCSIVPKEILKKYGNAFGNNPIGTGPFQYKSWTQDEALVLHKNKNYFEKNGQGISLPYIDSIRVSFVKDRRIVIQELMNGNLDFVFALEAYDVDELLKEEGELKSNLTNQLQLIKSPYLYYEQSLLEKNDNKEYTVSKKKDTKLIEDAPFVFLLYNKRTSFAKKNSTDLINNAINLLSLKRVRK